MQLTAADRAAIAALTPLVEAALTPAPVEQLALWVQFLIERYRMKPDTPAFADMDKRMWLTVLGHWPADVLEAAVTQWCSENRPFPPQVPGELKALGEPIYRARAALKTRAARVLALPAPETFERDEGVARGLSALAATLGRNIGKRAPAPSVTALTKRFSGTV
jgi:hypothetical protein